MIRSRIYPFLLEARAKVINKQRGIKFHNGKTPTEETLPMIRIVVDIQLLKEEEVLKYFKGYRFKFDMIY